MTTSDLPTLVFVHGGQHTGACWQPTIDAIAAHADGASVRTLAVDLPGRRGQPGDLATLTIEQCVQSVVRQIADDGAGEVVLVGHSMAGITVPGVAAVLGADRVRRIVYLACCVPPQGGTVFSTLRPPVNWIAKVMSRVQKVSRPIPGPVAVWMFANGMSKQQQRQMVAGLVPDSATVGREPVDRSALPNLPSTWIVTLRDNSLKPAQQRAFIANLGNVDEVVEIDTCHNAMMSEPTQLAELLLARVGRKHAG
jgi:pimeloyl-ACP methyl ester carboxylesterase